MKKPGAFPCRRKSPLGVITALERRERKNRKTERAPYKDPAMGYYNFLLLVWSCYRLFIN